MVKSIIAPFVIIKTQKNALARVKARKSYTKVRQGMKYPKHCSRTLKSGTIDGRRRMSEQHEAAFSVVLAQTPTGANALAEHHRSICV